MLQKTVYYLLLNVRLSFWFLLFSLSFSLYSIFSFLFPETSNLIGREEPTSGQLFVVKFGKLFQLRFSPKKVSHKIFNFFAPIWQKKVFWKFLKIFWHLLYFSTSLNLSFIYLRKLVTNFHFCARLLGSYHPILCENFEANF